MPFTLRNAKESSWCPLNLAKSLSCSAMFAASDTDFIVGCVNLRSYSSSLSKDLSLKFGREINREINYLVCYL